MKRSSFHPEDTRVRLHPLRFPFALCEKTGSKKGPAEPARIRRELKGLKNGSIDRLVSPLNHLPMARRPEAVSTPALPGTGSSIPGWRTILPRSLRRRSAASVDVQAMCIPAFIESWGVASVPEHPCFYRYLSVPRQPVPSHRNLVSHIARSRRWGNSRTRRAVRFRAGPEDDMKLSQPPSLLATDNAISVPNPIVSLYFQLVKNNNLGNFRKSLMKWSIIRSIPSPIRNTKLKRNTYSYKNNNIYSLHMETQVQK